MCISTMKILVIWLKFNWRLLLGAAWRISIVLGITSALYGLHAIT